MSEATGKKFDVKSILGTVKGAFKSAIPATKGGKIVAGSALGLTAVGGFVLGRKTKKASKK